MRIAICLAVLVAVAVVCVINYHALENNLTALEEQIEQVAAALEAEDWENADVAMLSAYDTWARLHPFYALIARHGLYDPVTEGIKTLPKLIQAQQEEAYAAAVQLKQEIALVREAEEYRWYNIL